MTSQTHVEIIHPDAFAKDTWVSANYDTADESRSVAIIAHYGPGFTGNGERRTVAIKLNRGNLDAFIESLNKARVEMWPDAE